MDKIAAIKRDMRIRTLCGILGLPIKNGFIRSAINRDSSPSVKIYERSDTWYDFSAGAGGDVIDLYMRYTGADARVAIESIGKLLGMVDGQWMAPAVVKPSPTETKDVTGCMSDAEKERYYEVLGMTDDAVLALREVCLMRMNRNSEIFTWMYEYCSDAPNTAATRYLEKRGIFHATRKFFRVFTIREPYVLETRLNEKFPSGDLLRAGLMSAKGRLKFYFHRILISYLHEGRIVYLRGRYFDGDGNSKTNGAKYLGVADDGLGVNTARRFFNSDVLLRMLDGERLYIVEGEFDAMVLAERYNVIAVPGAGNWPEHKAAPLRRFAVTVVPDADDAGERLLERVRESIGAVDVKRLNGFAKDVTELLYG